MRCRFVRSTATAYRRAGRAAAGSCGRRTCTSCPAIRPWACGCPWTACPGTSATTASPGKSATRWRRAARWLRACGVWQTATAAPGPPGTSPFHQRMRRRSSPERHGARRRFWRRPCSSKCKGLRRRCRPDSPICRASPTTNSWCPSPSGSSPTMRTWARHVADHPHRALRGSPRRPHARLHAAGFPAGRLPAPRRGHRRHGRRAGDAGDDRGLHAAGGPSPAASSRSRPTPA